jgi:hypothetical protein
MTNQTVTLPPTVAGYATTPKATTPKATKPPMDFNVYRQMLKDAEAVTGYSASSPIYHKTDVEVLPKLIAMLDGVVSGTTQTGVADVKTVLDCLKDMQARKVAKIVAGTQFRSHK